MTNLRTINLSEEDMMALAQRKITNLPQSISPLVSKVCREMMMKTAKKMEIAPTLRFRAMLYASFGVIAAMERDPSWMIKQSATRAVKGYLNGTR